LANDPGFDADPGVAMTACFIGPRGVVFSVGHSQWALEAGSVMALWAVHEFAGGDAAEHFRQVAEMAGWIEGPVYVAPATEFRQVELLRRAFPASELRVADFVTPLRSLKSEAEIDLLRKAARLTAGAIRDACGELRNGISRLDLLAAVERQLLAAGVDRVVYGPDIWAIGPAISVDWSSPATLYADPVLIPPCSVSLDVGVSFRGYRADVGRTIFIGGVPPRSAEALDTLREARRVGVAALRPGRRAEEVDAITRSLIVERGFGAGFWIPSGHGIGLEIHEAPILRAGDRTVFQAGNVVNFELAIWQDGVAGAFAEDTVVIRDDGPEWLIDDGDQPVVVE